MRFGIFYELQLPKPWQEDSDHRLTSELVKRHKHFVVEDLQVGNMTRSAKGDAENPGRHVALQVGIEPVNP